MSPLSHILFALRAALADRRRLTLENIALRQQLAVLKRSVKRPKLEDRDRIFWISMVRALDTWRETLLIVKPETVVKWHRAGWKAYWRRKSKPKKIGRPAIGWSLVYLIKRLSKENVLWGAPRIASELKVLGHDVAETTVAKYMVRHRPSGSSQTWSTFLRNHMANTIACDFFTVPTVAFRNLYVFVVLHHGSRRILKVGVTEHPTAEWTAQNLVEVVGDHEVLNLTHLIRDRDTIYGDVFKRKAKALGLEDIVTPKASPWCNGFAERVIGTIRRECTDHIIPFDERHLLRVVKEFAAYYNRERCHQSLDGDAPVKRRRWSEADGDVTARRVLGGLHHVYSRAA